MGNSIDKKDLKKAEFIIETKINSFLSKNNGTGYILFFDKDEMNVEYTIPVIKEMIKDTIDLSNFESEHNIPYNKKELLIFNINDYKYGKEIIEKEFYLDEFPVLFKFNKFDIVGIYKELLYIDKI